MNRAPATRPRLLVVDDEPDTCANLSDILSDQGYDVDVAYSGEQALEQLARRPYDIALLDLKMPGIDGLELYRRMRSKAPATAAILVTAFAQDERSQTAIGEGAWRVLPKPVDCSTLLKIVADVTSQPLLLLVDDDRELCQVLWDVLREQHIRCGLAASVDSAARELQTRAFDVVIIDLKLQQGDGAQVFAQVREHNPAARTVLITGFRDEMTELVDRVRAEGADAVCFKPFNVQELLNTVRQLARKVG